MEVEKHIEEFAKTHSRRETFLYNNNCYAMWIIYSDKRAKQYEINRMWILNYFK